jgi:lipopolysaccharide/colanic/teichoic acid biosynthesis glycosyltransferase
MENKEEEKRIEESKGNVNKKDEDRRRLTNFGAFIRIVV